MSTDYRNFLALSYEELEELNLAAKADRAGRVAADQVREKRLKYLTDEKRIKAVTVLFTDLEGRLHLLDYDKKFLLGSYENLTFDGSSIRGFTAQKESDLRLGIDWSAFYWVPADVFGNGKVWLLGLLYFCIAMGNYGLVFWMPTMIRAAGVANLGNIGLLSAVPSLISAVAMILVAGHADRRNERRVHVAVCCLLGAAGMLASVLLAQHLWWSIAALIVAAIGINSIAPVFWGIPTAMMSGAGAAAAIALINSTGNLAGFVSPYVIGYLKDSTGQLLPGMIVLACALVAGALLVLSLKPQRGQA